MNPPAAPTLTLRKARVIFSREQVVLDDVHLDFPSGTRTSLVGPSGCGKTTLLRVLAGLQRLSSGILTTEPPVDPSGHENATAFVFQQPALLPWQRVLGNVRLPLELGNRRGSGHRRGKTGRDEADRRATEMLAEVGLAGQLEKYPHQLSGGMQMRVSIARALVTRPGTLLLDEPFAALDDGLRHSLGQTVLQMWASRRFTMVMVTHNLAEAITMSDRIVVLDSGRVHQTIDNPLADSTAPDIRRTAEFGEFFGTLVDAIASAAKSPLPSFV